MPFLEVEGVTGGYGRIAVLHDVGFTADAGRITAMLGTNGAGKTTSLRAIMGTASIHRGSIRIDGTDITGWSSNRIIRETGIAIVPEGRALFPELSVRENLVMGAYPIRADGREIGRRVDAVADRFEVVRRKMQHKANTLSGGEQQMVAIGRALMSRPRLLLADEVSQGLAPVIVQRIWKFFTDVLEDGTSVLLVEQNVSAALKVAHSAIHLRDGRVVDQGDPGRFRDEDGLLTNFI